MEVYVFIEERTTMEDQLFPINTVSDGTAHTIKAQYYKSGKANFERSGSFAATGVAEVVAEPGILRKFRTEEQKEHRRLTKGADEHFSGREVRVASDGISNTLTSVQKDNLLAEPQVLPHSQWKEQSLFIPEATKKGYTEVPDGAVFDASYPESATRRGRVQEGGSVSPTLTTSSESALRLNQRYRIRKLTPRECFRLMGVSEKDIDTIQGAGISNSQQYKMAGNSIVVDVLEVIFRELFRFNPIENAQ